MVVYSTLVLLNTPPRLVRRVSHQRWEIVFERRHVVQAVRYGAVDNKYVALSEALRHSDEYVNT